MYESFEYQIAAQQNAIFRSRAEGIQWTVLCDLDEYVFVLKSTTNTTITSSERPLSSFLKAQEVTIGGVEGQTVSYGNNGTRPPNSPPNWTMDYVWRSKHGFGNRRQKTIANNRYIDYHEIHFLSLGGPRQKVNPWTELRFNHYKNPWNGAFGTKEAVKDIRFRDLYKERLVKEMETLMVKIGRNLTNSAQQ
jgi:hypothetical protein